MDIPLKSQPKVSMVSLLDESKFTLFDSNNIEYDKNEIEYDENESNNMGSQRRLREMDNSSGNIGTNNEIITDKKDNNYRFSRAFSKTDNSRDTIQGPHDKGVQRLRSRTQSPDSNYSHMSPNNEYNGYSEYLSGLEDEYIPGLNFEDMIYKWNKSDQNLSRLYDETVSTSASTSTSNTPLSRDASYLDLNKLHAKVSPQPIALRGHLNSNNKHSFSKLSDFMKASRVPRNTSSTAPATTNNKDVNNSTSTLTSAINSDHKKRRLKSSQVFDPNTGDINYEMILSSLPPNFNDLPYSQRRKVVKSFSESIDYSQFSLFAKQYLTDKLPSSSGKTPGSGSNNESFARRSRHNSTNTLAGRLLALSSSSSSDLKKTEEMQPKKNNVDEKGAIVMGYELGKIIGFGAWGTIRECSGEGGVIKAVKIVKSSRNLDNASSPSLSLSNKNSPTHSVPPQHNPKVLEVFRKEINIWKRLKHDNILPLINHLETDTAIFCITNRIFGGTLFELVSSWGVYDFGIQNMTGPVSFLIENQRIRLSQTKTFVKQIVSALTYLHEEMGVVHGDLKLENALVDDRKKDDLKVILCDFGMSRVYSSRRVNNKSSVLSPTQNSPSSTIRSKSSTTDLRKPYHGGDTKNTKYLFTDDSKIGLYHSFKGLGPSLQSVDLTPEHSHHSLYQSHETRKLNESKIDSGLPHSHIGSLPYASPEILLPSPPPLGPSADIWALGVLMYTMCTGKLPFQHPYEPTLRSIITSGDYNKFDLKKACLLQWILLDDPENENESSSDTDSATEVDKSELAKSERRSNSMFSSSFVDNKREREIDELHKQWLQYNKFEFRWLFDIIKGSLQTNITKRWDLNKIYHSVHVC